jgi:DNA-binding PadR family transcriptional regulator
MSDSFIMTQPSHKSQQLVWKRSPMVLDRFLMGDRVDMCRSSAYTSPVSKQSMQEPTFLILTALAAGAQHGYGIMTDVARISDGRVRLRAGTLYAALDRLKADGLVTGDKEEIVDGRLRRYYRITDEGTAELAAEVSRLRANAAVAASRLGLAGGTV